MVAQGIRLHVDQGAYSVNCWLTPDDANLDLHSKGVSDGETGNRGGLRIFRGPAFDGPDFLAGFESNDFRKANQDFRSLKRALDAAIDESTHSAAGNERSKGEVEALDIDYRQNRCIVFRSSLLHESGTPNFKPGYRNRRINLTFMFGNSASFISSE